jgi:hypothetical protein
MEKDYNITPLAAIGHHTNIQLRMSLPNWFIQLMIIEESRISFFLPIKMP